MSAVRRSNRGNTRKGIENMEYGYGFAGFTPYVEIPHVLYLIFGRDISQGRLSWTYIPCLVRASGSLSGDCRCLLDFLKEKSCKLSG